ncbi:MAG: hypothetical protein Fur0043_21620 [Anaerolineales bacterium]
MSFVHLRNVTYKYPLTDRFVLEDINLQIEEGEFVAVIGPNGAGKSTLCYTLSGFIPHFYKGELSGVVEVAGVETHQSTLDQWVLNVGLAFQNPFNQISGAKYTVFEEIAFGLENIGVPRHEMKERVERALEMTGIRDLADRSPYSLSGGQQQRVALTSILVMEPRLLVLDEPTSQMDPIGTREVFGVVRKMAERGMTVVLAEHKMEWIAQFADRVIALYEGKILLDGKPGEVLTSDLLTGKGFGLSRYTSTAREAQKQGLWPKDKSLPVTLDEALQGFSLTPGPSPKGEERKNEHRNPQLASHLSRRRPGFERHFPDHPGWRTGGYRRTEWSRENHPCQAPERPAFAYLWLGFHRRLGHHPISGGETCFPCGVRVPEPR